MVQNGLVNIYGFTYREMLPSVLIGESKLSYEYRDSWLFKVPRIRDC